VRKPKQEKHAYDSRIALWLGRDPIQENGGVNLYGMVGNDPENLLDRLGLHAIKVEKCNIYIHIDHRNRIRKNDTTLDFSAGFSAGGMITCWPGDVNRQIPEASRLRGSPMHDYPMAPSDATDPTAHRQRDRAQTRAQNEGSNRNDYETYFDYALSNMFDDADNKFKELCKCDCTEVTLTVVNTTEFDFKNIRHIGGLKAGATFKVTTKCPGK